MKSAKQITIMAACVLCGSFLSGCAGKVEQTNQELTIYAMPGNGMMEMAANIFKETYPEVEVHYIEAQINANEDDIRNEAERTATELMAGGGADVFALQTQWDIEKMVERKAFADLSPYFDSDPYFEGDQWVHKIFEGGCKEGYRFAIPTEYTMQTLFTSREALEEAGIDRGKLMDFNGFLDETLRYMEQEDARSLLHVTEIPIQFLLWSGYPVIDWEAGAVDLENKQVERYFTWYKAVRQQANIWKDFRAEADAAGIRDGKLLFGGGRWHNCFGTICTGNRLIRTFDQPVMIPVRNVDGGITACARVSLGVRANSANVLNAYRFIKIYMSTPVQTSITGRAGGYYKVNREAQEYNYRIDGYLYYGQEQQGFPAECPPFPEDEYAQLMSCVDEIDMVLPNVPNECQWLDMLEETMTPYVNGECTYEEAIKQAMYELEIYVSE